MTSFRLFQGLILGALVVVTGCGGADEGSLSPVEPPSLDLQGGMSGSGGVNGMSPSNYHPNVGKLLSAMSVSAADPANASAVNPDVIATGLLATAGGREVFTYAAKCALPQGTTLSYGGNPYAGGGMLSTTSGWLSGGLETPEKEDVLTCMIAHLNAVGAHVPIFLSGPSVTAAESADDGNFSLEEAIWRAKIPASGTAPIYHAFPRTNLLSTCGLLSATYLVTRICGTVLNTCGVQIRYDQATACTGSNGNYTCDGAPAIETWLEPGTLCGLVSPLL